MPEDNLYYSAIDVANLLNVSEQKAYSIIRQLNMEQRNQGYQVIKGRVLKSYLRERYGLNDEGACARKETMD